MPFLPLYNFILIANVLFKIFKYFCYATITYHSVCRGVYLMWDEQRSITIQKRKQNIKNSPACLGEFVQKIKYPTTSQPNKKAHNRNEINKKNGANASVAKAVDCS